MIRQIIEERVYSGLQNQKVRVHNGTDSKLQSQQLNLEAETSRLKSQIEVKRVHLEWHVALETHILPSATHFLQYGHISNVLQAPTIRGPGIQMPERPGEHLI